MPWWSIILFTAISAVIAVCLGFSTPCFPLPALHTLTALPLSVTATTGFQISIKYAIQVLASFIHPGKPMYVAPSSLLRADSDPDLACSQYGHVRELVREQHRLPDPCDAAGCVHFVPVA